ncbi:MAG: sigma-70 family RNA polymerase sigma factor [Actinobacteria bacterium]|nr:sigma-70 family RNA polymerase sigma factor [Actinomycetota bacterium]
MTLDHEVLAELAAAAGGGDRAAMESLLAALYDPICVVTRRICGPDHDDATQQTLIAVARGIRRFDGRSAVTTWVYRIATNAALDEMRRRARHGSHADLESAEVLDRPAPYDQVDDQLLIAHALESLTPDHRAAVVLREVAQLDYAEIADILEIPVGTVRSRLARARRHLAEALTQGNESFIVDVQQGEP